MSNFERILKRGRQADEAKLDDLRLVVMARLAAANGDAADHLPVSDQRPVILRRVNGNAPGAAIAHPMNGAEPPTPSSWLLVAPLEDAPARAAGPGVVETGPQTPAGVDLDEGPADGATPDGAPAGEPSIATGALDIEADREHVVDAADSTVPPSRRRRRHARPAADRLPADPTACCPYCAALLQPPPDTDDRCPRCQQRMIVRYVGGRRAILAEAVLPFFEAERLNEERRTHERNRWLELAVTSGLEEDQLPQLAEAWISESDVAAARDCYLASVDRAFRLAERDRRWDDAARIRYEQVDVLSRTAGSAAAPSDEIVRLHRDAVAADLQVIGEVARDAEIRGESCCDACRADERRVVRIDEELASPTLPHRGCPDVPCRCRWFLTARDEEHLAALLRRQMAADRRTVDPPDARGGDDAIPKSA